MVMDGPTIKGRINRAVVECLRKVGTDREVLEILLNNADMLQLYLECEVFRNHYRGFSRFYADAKKYGVAWTTVEGFATVYPQDSVKGIVVRFAKIEDKRNGKAERPGTSEKRSGADALSETLAGPLDRIH
jgi:hypothetical protein